MRALLPLSALFLAGAFTASAVALRPEPVRAPGAAKPSAGAQPALAVVDAAVTERTASPPSPLLEPYLEALSKHRKGAELDLLKDDAFLRAAAFVRDQLLAQAYVDAHRAELLRGGEVSEQDLRAAYEAHRRDYMSTPTFTARHLLVYRKDNPAFPGKGLSSEEARSRAETARRRLLGGESWSVVARELSDDAGTKEREGLMRESRWGLLPPSVEKVMRSVSLGVPSPVIESPFGYHVVEVESRELEPTELPFERVRDGLREQLANERQKSVGRDFLEPLYRSLKLTRTEAGRSEAHLGAEGAVAADVILASVGERTIAEADLRQFIRDTVPASQKNLAFARPHARQAMLTSYLDVVVLSEMARRGGLEEGSVRDGVRQGLESLLASLAQSRP